MQSLLLHERRSKSPPPRMSHEQLAPRISMNNRSDPYPQQVQASEDEDDFFAGCCKLVNGALIIGAGPSGMAVAACLRTAGVPFVILERENCIASLWQRRAYDRLQLNVRKELCQLPYIPFPDDFPERLSKQHLIDYLLSYARRFEIDPRFNETVLSAKYDETCGLWRVETYNSGGSTVVYFCRWLVVASGENAEKVEPEFEGLRDEFDGRVIHACDYKSGESYRGKRVLVVGSGNSGFDISLDLLQYNAIPTMVVRDSGRDLPWEYLVGVKIVPGIKKFSSGAVELDNGEVVDIDSVILATGYTSNVSSWLEKNDLFSSNGYPLKPFPHGWKGRGGIYAAGFTRRGLYGASADAIQVAADLSNLWKQNSTRSPFTDIKFPVMDEQRPRKVARCQLIDSEFRE